MRRGLAAAFVVFCFVSGTTCNADLDSRKPLTPDNTTVDPEAAHAMGVRLQSEGKHVASLAWFRAAARILPEVGRLHLDYATALHNASIAMDTSRGAVRFEVPRSQDRARLRHEALRELARAISLSRDPGEQAYSLFSRARLLELMGYPLDALEDCDRALRLRPGEPVLLVMGRRLEARVRPPAPASQVGGSPARASHRAARP